MTIVRVGGMPKPLKLPYIVRQVSRGHVYYYFRAKGVKRTRLHPDRADFLTEYNKLLAQARRLEPEADQPISPNSVRWLVTRYKESGDYRHLAASTRLQYAKYLDILLKCAAQMRYEEMPRSFIKDLRNEFYDTPAKANQLVKIISALYVWAIEDGHASDNPAKHIKPIRIEGGGHRPWEEHELQAFRERWPVGTLERTTFELMLGSCQRRSDVIKMQWKQLDQTTGKIELVQQKTGNRVSVPLPQRTLDALAAWRGGDGHLTILVTSRGKALTDNAFTKMMRRALNEAGLHHRKPHGLRYTGARTLLELGASLAVVAQYTGHKSAQVAEKYAFTERETSAAVVAINELDERRKKEASKRGNGY